MNYVNLYLQPLNRLIAFSLVAQDRIASGYWTTAIILITIQYLCFRFAVAFGIYAT